MTDWKKYQAMTDDEKVDKIIAWLKSPRAGREVFLLAIKLCSDDNEEAMRLYRIATEKFFNFGGNNAQKENS